MGPLNQQQFENTVERFAEIDLSDLAKRSLWDGRNQSDVWSFYCPLCACARRVTGRPRPGGIRHVAQIALSTAMFMLAAWPWFSWKGAVAIVPLWAAFEVFYRLRMRAALACPHCGFDPFLYLRDRASARREVERHWRRRFEEKGIPYPEKGSKKGKKSAPSAAQ
ncbi:MAG: hypothetical protein A2X94_17315 [Bdellovibrionales bacterium GWB1_55_8]|nr:MAG: hypothetical protein A2X94_17315 [Bdellovibrionales bacterium GWB1_55_8]